MVGGGVGMLGVGCPCPSVRNDIVTPRHLLSQVTNLTDTSHSVFVCLFVCHSFHAFLTGHFPRVTVQTQQSEDLMKCGRRPARKSKSGGEDYERRRGSDDSTGEALHSRLAQRLEASDLSKEATSKV